MVPDSLDDSCPEEEDWNGEVRERLTLLKAGQSNIVEQLGAERLDAAERVHAVWAKALEWADLIQYQIRDDFAWFVAATSQQGDSHVRETALKALHLRAQRVFGEVLSLLCAGFADGAHGRQRTLHEFAVVARVLNQADENTARKYWDHAVVSRCNFARSTDFLRDSNDGPIPRNVQEALDLEAELVKTYGRSFRGQYGWASELLRVPNPGLADLEKYAGMEHLRPLYKAGSENVHAGAHGISFSLGAGEDAGLPAWGPTELGLAWPGSRSCEAVVMVNMSMLGAFICRETVVRVQVISSLLQNAHEAFGLVEANQSHAETDDSSTGLGRDN